jgi:hypothetical protein
LIYQPINDYVRIVGYELHQQGRPGWLGRRAAMPVNYAMPDRDDGRGLHRGSGRRFHMGHRRYRRGLLLVMGPQQKHCKNHRRRKR